MEALDKGIPASPTAAEHVRGVRRDVIWRLETLFWVNDGLPRNCWLLGRVLSASPSSDGLVRMVKVKTKNGVLLRPVHKLCFIESGIIGLLQIHSRPFTNSLRLMQVGVLKWVFKRLSNFKHSIRVRFRV